MCWSVGRFPTLYVGEVWNEKTRTGVLFLGFQLPSRRLSPIHPNYWCFSKPNLSVMEGSRTDFLLCRLSTLFVFSPVFKTISKTCACP